ncbi:MAG: hypothetical protein J5722_05215 [Oscillospiraceae bacterium]|nr:hypothetical protein [Oscillospiraceae bacterium]
MNAQELFDAFRDTDPAFLDEADQLADRAAEQASCTADTQPENEIQQIFAQYSGSRAKAPAYHLDEHETAAKTDVFADLTGSSAGIPVRQNIAPPEEPSSIGTIFRRIGGIAAAVAIFSIGAFALSVILSRNNGIGTIPAAQPTADSEPEVAVQNGTAQDGSGSDANFILKVNGEQYRGSDISGETEVDSNGNTIYHFKVDGQTITAEGSDIPQLITFDDYSDLSHSFVNVPLINVRCGGGTPRNTESEDCQPVLYQPDQTPVELTLTPVYRTTGDEKINQAIQDALESGDEEQIRKAYANFRENVVPAVISPTEAGCNYRICIYQDDKLLDITDPETGKTLKSYAFSLTENMDENTKKITFTPLPTDDPEGAKIVIHAIGMKPNDCYDNNSTYSFRVQTAAPGTEPYLVNPDTDAANP